jgi:hypothetical protein
MQFFESIISENRGGLADFSKKSWVFQDHQFEPKREKIGNILNFGFGKSFDLIKIQTFYLDENVRLDEFYNFDAGLDIQCVYMWDVGRKKLKYMYQARITY